MRRDSAIDPLMLRAYAETEYRVHGSPGFTLRVGQASTELREVHARHGVTCSAYLTAFNPFSRAVGADENASRQAALLAEVARLGLVALPGLGQHPSNDWPGEDSVLILGLGLEAAKALGERFEQNAFVWCGEEGVPELVLLR